MELSRRTFLRSAGAAAVTLTLANLELAWGADSSSASRPAQSAPGDVPAYRGWEDLYRQKWTWDLRAAMERVSAYVNHLPSESTVIPLPQPAQTVRVLSENGAQSTPNVPRRSGLTRESY